VKSNSKYYAASPSGCQRHFILCDGISCLKTTGICVCHLNLIEDIAVSVPLFGGGDFPVAVVMLPVVACVRCI